MTARRVPVEATRPRPLPVMAATAKRAVRGWRRTGAAAAVLVLAMRLPGAGGSLLLLLPQLAEATDTSLRSSTSAGDTLLTRLDAQDALISKLTQQLARQEELLQLLLLRGHPEHSSPIQRSADALPSRRLAAGADEPQETAAEFGLGDAVMLAGSRSGVLEIKANHTTIRGGLSVQDTLEAPSFSGDGSSLSGVQRRVAGECVAGSAIRVVRADGLVECETALVGPPGPQGDASVVPGPVGADGAPGPPGAKGDAGANGDKGEPGADGSNGADSTVAGPAGAAGAAGPAGPAGPVGPTGPTGNKGNTGPSYGCVLAGSEGCPSGFFGRGTYGVIMESGSTCPGYFGGGHGSGWTWCHGTMCCVTGTSG